MPSTLQPLKQTSFKCSLYVVYAKYIFHAAADRTFPGKEEMVSFLQEQEKDLKETFREKDKALQQLNRLKKHLLLV
ncbi:hypothetical protein Tco_0178533 [Tanacetum coccineum]